MTLTFDTTTLDSRIVHAEVETARTIAKTASGILPKLKSWLGAAFGAVVKYFNLSFSSLWDMFVSAYLSLKTFNWNETDEELQKQIERNNQTLVVQAAQTLGNYLGFGAVRIANAWLGRFTGNRAKSTVAALKIPVLSADIGLRLAEEQNEELAIGVKRFLSSTTKLQLANGFIAGVLTARKNHWFGFESITTPKTNGSIAHKIEEQIEKLPKFWQRPVEELIESFEEGIIEAGYIVSSTIDDHVRASQYALRNNGPERTVEVVLDPDTDEKITLRDNQGDVEDILDTTLLGTYPLIKNRDVGQILADDVEESVKLKVQLRKVILNFNEHEKPPYTRNRKVGRRSTISIPDAKSGLDWQKLRSAVPFYQSGNYFCQVSLANGRQMSGWFASEGEGERVLTKLSALSTSKIVSESFRASKGKNSAGTSKNQKMLISFASLLYPKRTNGKNIGPRGKSVKMPLYGSKAPEGIKPFV